MLHALVVRCAGDASERGLPSAALAHSRRLKPRQRRRQPRRRRRRHRRGEAQRCDAGIAGECRQRCDAFVILLQDFREMKLR